MSDEIKGIDKKRGEEIIKEELKKRFGANAVFKTGMRTGKNNSLLIEIKQYDPKLDEHCYFCDYDKVLEEHHIIRKKDGGSNDNSNLLMLCPNCHALLHKRMYCLKYKAMVGWWIMESLTDNGKNILLNIRQRERYKKFPLNDLKNAERIGKLEIK